MTFIQGSGSRVQLSRSLPNGGATLLNLLKDGLDAIESVNKNAFSWNISIIITLQCFDQVQYWPKVEY